MRVGVTYFVVAEESGTVSPFDRNSAPFVTTRQVFEWLLSLLGLPGPFSSPAQIPTMWALVVARAEPRSEYFMEAP